MTSYLITEEQRQGFMENVQKLRSIANIDHTESPTLAMLQSLTPVDDDLTIAYLDGYHRGKSTPLRELSDAEIDAITTEQWGKYAIPPAYRAFARAILRAAKETK